MTYKYDNSTRADFRLRSLCILHGEGMGERGEAEVFWRVSENFRENFRGVLKNFGYGKEGGGRGVPIFTGLPNPNPRKCNSCATY